MEFSMHNDLGHGLGHALYSLTNLLYCSGPEVVYITQTSVGMDPANPRPYIRGDQDPIVCVLMPLGHPATTTLGSQDRLEPS